MKSSAGNRFSGGGFVKSTVGNHFSGAGFMKSTIGNRFSSGGFVNSGGDTVPLPRGVLRIPVAIAPLR